MGEMAPMICGECGIEYDIPQARYNDLKKTGDTFYCPNGHARVFRVGPTEDQKTIENLLAALNRTQVRMDEVWSELRDAKAATRRCPLCLQGLYRGNKTDVARARMVEHLTTAHHATPARPELVAAGQTGNAR